VTPSQLHRIGQCGFNTPSALESPPVLYMIWHETRRNDAAHRWLRVLRELCRFADR
jgi:hypothetical protein